MNKLNKIRLPLDIMMTLVSIVLMGGNFLFPAEIVHEILGLGFARIAHLLASHWYYLFMSLHIGLHMGRFFQNIVAKIFPRILLVLTSLYGLYAFIARGVWKYLILKQQFFFFDLERGYILFAMDYISIIILFAVVSRLVAAILKRRCD